MHRTTILGRKARCVALGAFALLPAATAAGQQYAPAPVPTSTVRVEQPSSRLYGGVEYLYWWVKDAPLSVPLISTGPRSNKDGFILNSNTTILYGAPQSPAVGGRDSQSFPGASGARLTLGYWLDDARLTAIEASAFKLQRVTGNYSTSSNGAGTPGIRIPVYNSVPYAPGGSCDNANPTACLIGVMEEGVPVAVPGSLYGTASARNSLELWGADLGAVRKLFAGPSWEVSGLAGLRYLDLAEGFSLTDNLNGISGTFFTGQSGTAVDSFKTRNQFYGAAFGLRGSYRYGPFVGELSGRVGLGVTHETLSVRGSFVQAGANFPASGPYGVFAMPANSGQFSSNKFAVVPDVQVKLGYDVTPSIRLTVGYDFLYASNVIRPGDQIDRNIPKGQTFQQDGTAPSTTSPSKLFRTTDFFAHGLSAGVRLTF